LALALGALLLGACGSSGSAAGSGTSVQQACHKVSAAASDGPDPDADPIGYAEAQVLPLRNIRTSDKDLQSAIDALASAYQDVFDTNGSASATHALARSSHAVDAICPGALS
jgi:hypothetical protein